MLNTTKPSKSASLSVSSSKSSRSTNREVKDNEQEISQVDHGRRCEGEERHHLLILLQVNNQISFGKTGYLLSRECPTWNGWAESEKLFQLAGHFEREAPARMDSSWRGCYQEFWNSLGYTAK